MSVYPPLRQVREDGKDKNSVVSFNLTDEPHHIDLFTSNSKEEVRRLLHWRLFGVGCQFCLNKCQLKLAKHSPVMNSIALRSTGCGRLSFYLTV